MFGSSDGLIDEDGIIEIKCLFSAANITVEEAIEISPDVRNIFDKKNPEMNRNHRFFYQTRPIEYYTTKLLHFRCMDAKKQ